MNTLFSNPWVISISASLAAVGIGTILSKIYSSIREGFDPHSGKYLMVTNAIEPNRYFAEILEMKVSRGNIRGNIKTLYFIETNQNSRYKYDQVGSSFRIKGNKHQRVITISYISKDRAELDTGSFTIKIESNGQICTGYWSGIVMNHIECRPTRWLKLDAETSVEIKKKVKALVESFNEHSFLVNNSNYRFESDSNTKAMLGNLSKQGIRSLLYTLNSSMNVDNNAKVNDDEKS
jgi:hypothetical protein